MLQALVGHDDESEFRFLVDDIHVKYITIDHGLWSPEDLVFAPILIPLLPAFPPGDWNVGRISKDPTTGQPTFSEFTKESLPAVQQTWHPTFINILDLPMDPDCELRSGVYRTIHPTLAPTTAVAKFALFPWEIQWLDDKTRAYQWLVGQSFAPKFLGHLTEEGRVIGSLMEDFPDSRHAGPEDLGVCQEVVGWLHGLGIRHGDLNRFNFLIIGEGERAVLIDFDTARKCEDEKKLRVEFEGLVESLKDESGRGGVIVDGKDGGAPLIVGSLPASRSN